MVLSDSHRSTNDTDFVPCCHIFRVNTKLAALKAPAVSVVSVKFRYLELLLQLKLLIIIIHVWLLFLLLSKMADPALTLFMLQRPR